ncbi:MAG: autotransporter domain-containing protein [Sutterella sp.]|nr:autotransporter domain-containing protein [Sutterella sp.]
MSAAQTIEAGAVISTVTDTPAQEGKAVAYLDRTVKLDTNGQINLGTPDGAADKTLSVGENGVLIVNATGNYDGAVIDGNLTIDSDGEIAIENFTKAGTLLIATGTVTNNASTEIKSDNIFLTGNFEQVTQGESQVWAITATAADNVSTDAAFNAAAKRVVNGEGDALAREVLAAIGDTTQEASPFIDSTTGKLSDAGIQAASEFMADPVVSGAYNVAYDAAAEVSRVVMNRNVQGEGMGVWADVFYASNEAKKLYGDQGYSADIYGGVFGFDTVFSCGAKLGAALTIGQADADGERSFSKYSNDADFWGLSVYTGKNVADTSLYVGADLSYLWFDNDIKGTVAGVKADDKVDGEVFTVDLRADWTAYAGAFNVVPHAGVRYTSIDVDAFHGLDNGSVNVVELPVGVKVAGTFEPAAGWKLVPSVDFTVVPQVGDKEVSTLVGDVDVIDNLYNTTVGVEAVYGQYAFGLDAGYGFGSDDHQNATVKANFSYRF